MINNIGFMCGTFDLLHAGHIMAFIEAKKYCKILVVGINVGENIDSIINPKKSKPIFDINDRKLILENIKLIDKVYVYKNEEELISLMKLIKPDVRFLGDDYKNSKITGRDLCSNIHYIDRSHGKSSSTYKKILG